MEGRNLFFSSLRESRGRRPRLSARPVILTFAMTYPPWRAIPWEKARIHHGEPFHGKKPGTPLLAAGGNGPASPAYGCVKPRLAFPLESPLDESGGQAREIKLKSFPTEPPGRFTLCLPFRHKPSINVISFKFYYYFSMNYSIKVFIREFECVVIWE